MEPTKTGRSGSFDFHGIAMRIDQWSLTQRPAGRERLRWVGHVKGTFDVDQMTPEKFNRFNHPEMYGGGPCRIALGFDAKREYGTGDFRFSNTGIWPDPGGEFARFEADITADGIFHVANERP